VQALEKYIYIFISKLVSIFVQECVGYCVLFFFRTERWKVIGMEKCLFIGRYFCKVTLILNFVLQLDINAGKMYDK